MKKQQKKAVLALSGGMDSSSLLLNLLAKGYKVTALSFDYGQKHKAEIGRAVELIKYLQGQKMPVNHQIIDLTTLTPLLRSALISGGDEVPEGHYENENMKATVVPNRNKIFASLIQSVALSLSGEEKLDVKIGMGIHAGDHAIYPDCRQEFRDADFEAFQLGNWGAEKVEFYTPYLELDKAGILKDGENCCDKLNLDFDEIYKRTLTSYKPILLGKKWYSDYKSASSVERVEAFLEIDREDPAEYADETGIVNWNIVKSHVEGVLRT